MHSTDPTWRSAAAGVERSQLLRAGATPPAGPVLHAHTTRVAQTQVLRQWGTLFRPHWPLGNRNGPNPTPSRHIPAQRPCASCSPWSIRPGGTSPGSLGRVPGALRVHGAFGEYSSQAGFTLCVRGWGGSGVTWASHHANPASGQRNRAPARRCPHVVVRADTGGKARCLMRGPPGESAASRGHEYPRDRPQRRHPPWVIVPRPPTKKRHVGRSAAKTWHHRTPTATGCSEVHWARVLRPRVAMKAGMTSYGRMSEAESGLEASE